MKERLPLRLSSKIAKQERTNSDCVSDMLLIRVEGWPCRVVSELVVVTRVPVPKSRRGLVDDEMMGVYSRASDMRLKMV